ncbi:hypothetical protein [Emticicia sp. C21]|uniref:hypothetical protein n=1 Tax=Emticicia sp. C21 TaxID=2302915 RepID=UPI000E350D9A|nr:hypothetical protein [Emticicia sp. C21]RFS13717.1 hypothetical protein D0T08_25380 [Emticicia sp. C21]
MKKVVYLIFCLISFSSYSQFEKGKSYIGFDYSRNYRIPEIKGFKGSWISIVGIPTAGFFLKDNMLLGVNLRCRIPSKYVRQRFWGEGLGVTASFSPFLRLYKKSENKIIPFIQFSPEFGIVIGTKKIKFTDASGMAATIQSKEINIGAQIDAGVSFKLSKKVIFDASLYIVRVLSIRYSKTTGSAVDPVGRRHDFDTNMGFTGGFKVLF